MLLKKFKTIIIAISVIILLIIALFIITLIIGSRPIKSNYYSMVDAVGTLEKKYTAYGEYDVNSIESKSSEDLFDNYKIWYPSELNKKSSNKKYPVVIFVNGTGVPYKKYSSTFEHLASWGFIVIGNDDSNSATGKSSSITLDYIISLSKNKESIFYNKLDMNNIGISGHSQGGVGAINAATNFDNSNMFTSIYTASTTSLELANALEWDYDITKINIPYFMVASTGKLDAETITPLNSLIDNYKSIKNTEITVMARRKNIDHGNMLTHADGYMTAWFRYTLMNDKNAGKVFSGDSPEICQNLSNWQDVKIKNYKLN